MLVGIYFINRKSQKREAKKGMQYLEKTNLKITEEGVVLSQKSNERTIPWNYIVKIKKLKRLILIYYSPYISVAIPRRIMSDENLKLITDRLNASKDISKGNLVKVLLLAIFVAFNLAAFYLYIEQTNLNYLFFDDDTIIERPSNYDKAFHYPYLIYIPPNRANETYLIIKPNTSAREKYYHSDDLEDAKIMLKKWVSTTSKYRLDYPVLVPVFPRQEEPEWKEEYRGKQGAEAYQKKMKAYYDKQWLENFKRQLYKMSVDARSYLLTKDINTPKGELVVFGRIYRENLSSIFSKYYENETKALLYDNPVTYKRTAIDLLKERYLKLKEQTKNGS